MLLTAIAAFAFTASDQLPKTIRAKSAHWTMTIRTVDVVLDSNQPGPRFIGRLDILGPIKTRCVRSGWLRHGKRNIETFGEAVEDLSNIYKARIKEHFDHAEITLNGGDAASSYEVVISIYKRKVVKEIKEITDQGERKQVIWSNYDTGY